MVKNINKSLQSKMKNSNDKPYSSEIIQQPNKSNLDKRKTMTFIDNFMGAMR